MTFFSSIYFIKYKINIIIIIFIILNCNLIKINPNMRYREIFKNIKLKYYIINNINFNKEACKYTKVLLNKRFKPFDFENELIFFISLIICKIPFSFIRFGDGENFIMKGLNIKAKTDKWIWKPENQKFRKSLIDSVNICTNKNNFISIPCNNWYKSSKSILSFSKCNSTKYMSFATLFINKNFKIFKNFISHFINIESRWKIILVANSNINTNISWAYKYYPIPNHIVEKWEEYSKYTLPKLLKEALNNNLIFFISAGPAANIIVSQLTKINDKNIYIDFGSSIELITKGYSTRPYSNLKSIYSKQSCESFILKDKTLVYE